MKKTKSERKATGAPINERGLLTKSQAADYLSIGVSSLDRLISVGEIVPIRLGDNSPRIKRLDLDDWIETRPKAIRRPRGRNSIGESKEVA